MKVGKNSFWHKPIACPVCTAPLDAARDLRNVPQPPADGDATLCINCGYIFIFVVSPLGPVAFRAVKNQELRETIKTISQQGIVATFNPNEEPLKRLRVVAIGESLWQPVGEQY